MLLVFDGWSKISASMKRSASRIRLPDPDLPTYAENTPILERPSLTMCMWAGTSPAFTQEVWTNAGVTRRDP